VPSFDYARTAGTAKRLLTRFGQVVTVMREVAGGYDPTTGTVVPGSSEGYSIKGAVMNYRTQDVDGTRVLQSDKRILLAPDAAFAPKPGDRVTLADTTVLTVISVRETNPAGTAVLYELQVRA